MSLSRAGLALSLFLFISVCAAQQIQNVSFLEPSNANTLPDAPSGTKLMLMESADWTVPTQRMPTSESASSTDGFRGLIERGVHDQAEIYTAPFHKSALKVDLGVAAVTAGLIVTEPDSSEKFADISRSPSLAFSNVGLYGTIGTVGAFYLSSYVTHDAHSKETGLLGAEAIANAAITFNLLKVATGRERPLIATQNGRFWHYNRLSSSFPSGHAAMTWAGAAVIAHEYPKRWVQILAYGTAGAVAFSRYSGRQHFPSDVFFGSVMGYFIGRHIFDVHCREGLNCKKNNN